MNWIHAIEQIATEHADTVRTIRQRIEEIENTARTTNHNLDTNDS